MNISQNVLSSAIIEIVTLFYVGRFNSPPRNYYTKQNSPETCWDNLSVVHLRESHKSLTLKF